MSNYPLLSLAIWIPIVAGLAVLATGNDRNAPLARMLALLGAFAGFFVALPLWSGFDIGTSSMQFVELSAWIPGFNINYHLGVDLEQFRHDHCCRCRVGSHSAKSGSVQCSLSDYVGLDERHLYIA